MQKQYLKTVGSFNCIVEPPEAGWFGESSEKQTPFIRIPLAVTDDGPEKGTIAVWHGWLSEKALDNTIARLKEVFNFNGDLQALYDGKITLAGLPCNIATDEEIYEGKSRIRVAWLNPPGGGQAKPMEEGKVKSLIAKLNSRSKAIAKAQPTAVAGPNPVRVPTVATTAEPPEDDVLF